MGNKVPWKIGSIGMLIHLLVTTQSGFGVNLIFGLANLRKIAS